jgi:hypothetical protein
MAKLIISVKRQDQLIDQTFDSIGKKGLLNLMQTKVFKAVYKQKINGLFYMLRKRVNSFVKAEGKDFFEAEDKGNLSYVLQQKKDFEAFMYGGESHLRGNPAYDGFRNDRTGIISKITRMVSGGLVASKDYAVSNALGGGRVLDFFNRNGITIAWWVVNDEGVRI